MRPYSIGQVSDLLGVPAPTIRSWERRYGLGPRGRTGAGHRRYTGEDVAGLERMRDELAAGRGAGEAAAIARSVPGATPAVLVEELCAAAHGLDQAAITHVLELGCTLHGLPATIDLVLMPALRELGRRWSVGGCDVAAEHLATAAVQAWLRHAAPTGPPASGSDLVVLACAPPEQHTLALDALGLLLAHRGVRCLNLGARVPASSLRTAVSVSGAGAVVVSCQMPRHRRLAAAALSAAESASARLYYGGAAFREPSTRAGVPGRYLGESLARAAQQIEP